MKSKEELTALKEEVETLNKRLDELTDEELAQVSGGDGKNKLLFTKETEKGWTTPLKEQKHFLRKKRCFLPWLVQF